MLNKENFFKLSQPPSEKNPMVADCLKLFKNETFGRYIVTNRKLKSGEVIVIEKPFYKSLDMKHGCLRCVNCFRSALQPLVCSLCRLVAFCSTKCQQYAWKEFHELECSSIDKITEDDGFLMMIERSLFKALTVCGSLENLRKLVGKEVTASTIYDIDMNILGNSLNEQLILACFSLETSEPTGEEIEFAERFVDHHETVKSIHETQDQRNFLIKFILNLIGIMNRNSFTLHWGDETGCGIFPFSSLINHSCSPNLSRVCLHQNLVLITRHPIEANEQLFISYQ